MIDVRENPVLGALRSTARGLPVIIGWALGAAGRAPWIAGTPVGVAIVAAPAPRAMQALGI